MLQRQGRLNYKGMSNLRDAMSMQEDGTCMAYMSSGPRKRRRLLIPPSFLMQKSAKELQMHVKSLGINYEVRRDLGHEDMKCDCNVMLKFILKMHSLDKIPQNMKVLKLC